MRLNEVSITMPQNSQLPIDQTKERNASADAAKPPRQRREHKRVEYSGSRWAGVVLLLLTALLSLFFFLQGKGVTVPVGNILDRISGVLFGSSTMTFEK